MKKLIAVIMIAVTLLSFTGCGNKTIFDAVNRFDYAIVQFPDGSSKKIELKSWNDYDGEQLQLIAEDGTIYLVSSFNCVLVKE